MSAVMQGEFVNLLQLHGLDFLRPPLSIDGHFDTRLAVVLTVSICMILLQGLTFLFSIVVGRRSLLLIDLHVRQFFLFFLSQILALAFVAGLALSSLQLVTYPVFEYTSFVLILGYLGVASLGLYPDFDEKAVFLGVGGGLLFCMLATIGVNLRPVVYFMGLAIGGIIHCVASTFIDSLNHRFTRKSYLILSLFFLLLLLAPVFSVGISTFFTMTSLMCLISINQWFISLEQLWAHYKRTRISIDEERQFYIERESEKLDAIYKNLHDEVTGCPTDGYLVNFLNTKVSEGALSQFALLCVRVGGLRPVQNALGLDTANGLLRACAQRLAIIGHAFDDFLLVSDSENDVGTVVRSEGREFFMVSRTTEAKRIEYFSQRINESFSVPFEYGGLCLDLQANIGIALFPQHGQRPQQVMQHANVAVDTAKRGSQNSLFFDRMLGPSVQRRLILLGDLRGALNRGDIYLTYQPQICLASRQVVGVETLIRWKHPFLGKVPPDEFITLAEQTGMIRHITRWVVDHAAMDFIRMSLDGIQMKVSINVSPNNLLEDYFADVVLSILDQYEIPKQYFCIELTETAVMLDPEKVVSCVEALTSHGIIFSIDDFGTGYSSLSNLKRLKVKQLKIDKDFITNLEFDTEDEAIVKATIEMSHCLGLEVVAEGVETLATVEKLQSFGCNIAQGYYVSQALAIDELLDWLAARPHQLQKIRHVGHAV